MRSAWNDRAKLLLDWEEWRCYITAVFIINVLFYIVIVSASL